MLTYNWLLSYVKFNAKIRISPIKKVCFCLTLFDKSLNVKAKYINVILSLKQRFKTLIFYCNFKILM